MKLATLALLHAATASAWPAMAQATTVVRAPCSEGSATDSGLRSCQELLLTGYKGIGGTKVPAVLEQLNQRVKEQIGLVEGKKGYYQQVDPDPLNPPGQFFGPTICNLVPGPFNTSAEEKSGKRNRFGAACGNPVQVQCKRDGSDVDCKINKIWNPSPSASQGTLEDGYGRGGAIAATSCYYQQVINEVRDQRRITVTDQGGSPSPCSRLAQSIEGMSNDLTADINALKSQLTDKKNIADIANCEKSWDTNTDPRVRSDAGHLRQSAQQLCAQRLAIESMFAQLATCEIFARSNYSFRKQIGSEQGQLAIVRLLQDKIAKPCSKHCEKKLDPGIFNKPSNSQISECANSCYQDRMPAAFRDHVRELWENPNRCDPLTSRDAGSHDPLQAGGGLMLIGMLGFAPGRRRRPDRGAKAATLGAALALALQASLGTGCASGSSSGDTPVVDGCGGQGPGQTQPCGCEAPSMAGSGDCSTDDPGSGSVRAALIAAAEAGNTGVRSGLAAKKFESDKPPADNGGSLAQGEAASAGDISSTAISPQGAGPSSDGARPVAGAGKGRASGAGSGATGGGSGGAAFGNLSTSPSGGAQAAPSPTSDTGLGGGQYAANGGAAGGPGAGGFFSRSGDSDGIEGGGAGATEESFTPDGGGLGKAMGSEDPEDYFTRVGLGDDLFKIVERRYRHKSTAWTTDDLRAGRIGKPHAPH
jgi:hypothetical protein